MTLGSFPQRKHYETIPKSLSELDFFVSFFSHLTAIVNAHCPGAFDLLEPNEGAWKGGDAKDVEATDTFTEAWGAMTKAKRGAVGALCGKESGILLAPNPQVPPAFPTLPLGMKCFIDTAAATAALSTVPGLQYKHYTLVPSKVTQRAPQPPATEDLSLSHPHSDSPRVSRTPAIFGSCPKRSFGSTSSHT